MKESPSKSYITYNPINEPISAANSPKSATAKKLKIDTFSNASKHSPNYVPKGKNQSFSARNNLQSKTELEPIDENPLSSEVLRKKTYGIIRNVTTELASKKTKKYTNYVNMGILSEQYNID